VDRAIHLNITMGHRAGEVQFSVARGRCLHEAEIERALALL